MVNYRKGKSKISFTVFIFTISESKTWVVSLLSGPNHSYYIEAHIFPCSWNTSLVNNMIDLRYISRIWLLSTANNFILYISNEDLAESLLNINYINICKTELWYFFRNNDILERSRVEYKMNPSTVIIGNNIFPTRKWWNFSVILWRRFVSKSRTTKLFPWICYFFL